MTEKQRKRWDTRATSWITAAINLPVGAAFYAFGGWWMVAVVAVVSFLLGLATTAWLAWEEGSAHV